MKKRDLVKILLEQGCVLIRSNKHEIYEINGFPIAVPHGNEISKFTAKSILSELAKYKNKKSYNAGERKNQKRR